MAFHTDCITLHSVIQSRSPLFFSVSVVVLVTAFVAVVDATSLPTGYGGETTLSYSIPEEQPAGFPVANLLADVNANRAGVLIRPTTSGERPQLESLVFEVFRGTHSEYFAVESPSGRLRTNSTIDRELICYKMAACIVKLDVAIVRPSQHFKIFKLLITITDVNDNSPEFEQATMTVAISESVAIGYTLMLPAAVDRDHGAYGVRSYQLRSNDTANRFQLRDTTGSDEDEGGIGGDVMLVVNGKLDREIESVFRAELIAMDGGSPSRTGIIELILTIQDANDNSPVFDRQVYNVTVREDFPVNGVIVTVHATDADHGVNGQVVYSFGRQTATQYGDTFVLDRERGSLSLRRRLDYETATSYTMSVSATDRGADPRTIFAKIHIIVEDRNDNAPNIRVNALTTEQVAEIVENQPVGSFVAHISVDDIDAGPNGQVVCELLHSNGQFVLQSLAAPSSSTVDDVAEYKLLSNGIFDREVRSNYSLTLNCHDDGVPSLSSSRDLIVRVTDANDNVPSFDRASYSVSIDEELPVGQSLVKLIAGDQDIGENGRVEFALCKFDAVDLQRQSGTSATSKFPPVTVDRVTGVVTTAVVFDYEETRGRPTMELCVVAFDHGESVSLSATATLTLTVVDVNDRAPVFSHPVYTFGTYENQPRDTEIGRVVATDPDTPPHNRFEYVIIREMPPLHAFTIDAKNGRLATTRPLDREQISVHRLVLCAFDIDREELMSQTNVTVHVADRNDNAPVISFPDPENSTIDVSRQAPIGYVITRVFAADSDFALNARLSFQIVYGNSDLLFDVDPAFGAVSIGADLRHSLADRFDLIIAVSDAGVPPKSATLNLTVLLTSASWSEQAKWQTTGDKDHQADDDIFGLFQFGRHRFIVTILGCVTVLVVALLVSAIVCVKCRRSKLSARHRMYHCNDVTTVDQKLTKNLIIENNLPKSNPDGRQSSGTLLHVTPCDQATSRTDVSRYVDLPSATVPDECEPFYGSHVAAQRQTEELFNVPATFSRMHSQNGMDMNSKLDAVVYQVPDESSSTLPRSAIQQSNRPPVTYGQVEHPYTSSSSQHHHHHHQQQQQQQQQQQLIQTSCRRQHHPHIPYPADNNLPQTSPTVTFADTDSSSGCSSSNDVLPSSTTTSPSGGASRYATIASRPRVTETDLDQLMLDQRNVETIGSVNCAGPAFCSCSNRLDDIAISSTCDSDCVAASSVSRGNGYCCSVQPLVTSPEMMSAVAYDTDELPPPPSHLNNNEGRVTECNCVGDSAVNGREQHALAMGTMLSQTPTRCRQHPPPLPPPRLTSLGRQKNQ